MAERPKSDLDVIVIAELPGSRQRRGALAHMISGAVVLADRDGEAARLQADARAFLESGPPTLTEAQMRTLRYALTDLLGDLRPDDGPRGLAASRRSCSPPPGSSRSPPPAGGWAEARC